MAYEARSGRVIVGKGRYMQEYAFLIVLGVVAVIVIGVGIWLNMKGIKYKKAAKAEAAAAEAAAKAGKGPGAAGAGKDEFHKDDNLFAMKDGKRGEGEFFKDDEKEKKGGGKLESWDDY
jgi:hypothetical protein